MAVKAYKLRSIVNPFEKEVFEYLSSVLEKSTGDYILFGPVLMDGRELDGLIVGDGFMVALEAKAVKGHVLMRANTPVTVRTETGEIVGFEDRYEDPYIQAEKQWKELGTFIQNAFGETGFWFVSMLVFKQASTFDVTSQARDVNSKSSLIVALDEIPAFLAKLSTRYNKRSLSRAQQEALVKAIIQGPDELSQDEKNIFTRSVPPARDLRPLYTPPSPPAIPSPAAPEGDRPLGGRQEAVRAPIKPSIEKHRFPPPWFLWLSFFFLNPLWAFLIIKDQTQHWFVKLVATIFLLGEVVICLGFLYLVQICPACFGIAPAVPARSSTPDPVATAPANTLDVTSASAIELEPSPGTASACTLVWVETESEGFADKNRSMVWEEIVRERVAGSGMTAKQFYDQVVERNPALKADGYVFLAGKTYSLPQCE